jgi:hypothetical protein
MLAQALKEYKEHVNSQTRKCIVGTWSLTLSEEDQDAFTETLTDASLSTRALMSVLRTANANFSLEALRKHRTGECPCQA